MAADEVTETAPMQHRKTVSAQNRRPPAALLHPRYWPAWLGAGLLRASIWLPYGWRLALGRGLGRGLMPLLGRRRRIAERNLALCFPELDAAERADLLRRHFESAGIALFEIPTSWWAPDAHFNGLDHVQGLEHLQRAQEQGRGVILLSCHFTLLEISNRLLLRHAPFYGVYRKHKHPVIEWITAGSRERHCGKAIPRHAVREVIRSLKGNHAVWYAPDQNTSRKEGVFVDFFGIPASTNSGTARLAKLTGARVVPFYAARRDDGSGYDLILEPPLADYPSGDLRADTQRINDLIERWVRQNPAQYLWLHRRFGTRPRPEDPPMYD